MQRARRFRGSSPGITPIASRLLEFPLGSRLFELRLDFGGLVLADAFLDVLGRPLDEVLGLFEAQPRERPDFLDDLDLLVADGGKHDRELGLFLGSRGRGRAGARAGSNRNCGGGRNPPFLLEHFGGWAPQKDRGENEGFRRPPPGWRGPGARYA